MKPVAEQSPSCPWGPDPAVQMTDVWFGYDGRPVLKGVGLTVAGGDFASVVGPNGGGKTTLVRLILGLLRPDRGSIDVLGTRPREARTRIGYMPQHAAVDPQFPATAMDVVLMGRLNSAPVLGPFRRADRRAARAALEEVEMLGLRNRSFSDLSGGQRQRVLIARALVGQPQLLLLDEPTANLDVSMEAELYELLKRLNERMTIVVVSHDLGFVSQYVNTVICVRGEIVVHPTSEVTGEVIREVYGAEVHMVRHDHRHEEGLRP